MMTDVAIKPATIDDVPLILNFINALAEYEKLAHEVSATEALLRDTLFGAQPKAEVIIAYHHHEPVGFALFFHNYSTFLAKPGIYLEDLYVTPEARGLGIGKKLLRHLAQLALARDCGRLEWWVLDWNESALNFYRRLGAVPMDEWTVQRVTGDALRDLAKLEA